VAQTVDVLTDQFNRRSQNNNKVFVHCAMGMSRSATCVMMFLMKRFCLSMDDALSLVKHRREKIDPNEGFMSKLRQFEADNLKFPFDTENKRTDSHAMIMRRNTK
jgi:protein-tyrosine phosphatase